MHLFVVGDGLEYFAHEHPVPQPDGVFMLDVRLPQAGPYMAIAEFLPDGGTPQTFQQAFTTGEAFAPSSQSGRRRRAEDRRRRARQPRRVEGAEAATRSR